MNKFTEGPWLVTDILDSSLKNITASHLSNWFIAEDILEDDAHLIAAAHDMYKAISSALAISVLWLPEIVDSEHEHEAIALHTMRTMFLNVLASARGES